MKADNSLLNMLKYALLFIIAFLFYYNSIPNQLALDDVLVLKENKFVTRGIAGIKDVFLHDSFYGATGKPASQLSWRYRPLSLVSFAIEYSFFKTNWSAYHLVNVLVYALLCLSIFHFLKRWVFGSQTWYAFAATLFFLVMPVHTEVVANIKSRDELYALLFSVLFLNRFLHFVSNRQTSSLLLSCWWFLLAMLSKESAVLLVVIAPVLVYVMQPSASATASLGRTWFYALVAGVFITWRLSISSVPDAGNTIMTDPYLMATIEQKFSTIIFILGRYLQNLFVPPYLSYDYGFSHIPYKSFFDFSVILSALTTFALIAISVFGIIKKKLYGAFMFSYLIGIFLLSNAVLQVGPIMADRFLFSPSFFFATAIVLMIAELSDRFKGVKLAQAGMLALALLSIVSFNQVIARNADWKDNKTLYFADLPKVPESVRALAFCGTVVANELEEISDSLLRIEKAREAIAYFENAYQFYPDYANMYQDWGATYARINNIDSAIWAWNRLKDLNPNSINIKANEDYIKRYYYLNAIAKYNAALPQKDFKKLLSFQREAMSYDSTVTEGWLLLGKLYYLNGINDSARWAINMYLFVKPDDKAAKDLLISIP